MCSPIFMVSTLDLPGPPCRGLMVPGSAFLGAVHTG
jgi:hypothetical protein